MNIQNKHNYIITSFYNILYVKTPSEKFSGGGGGGGGGCEG